MRNLEILVACVLSFLPSAALAQDGVRGFDQLGSHLKIGDYVYVTDRTGAELKGRLVEIGASSLTVRGEDAAAATRRVESADVSAVSRRGGPRLLLGALAGTAAGAAGGALVGYGVCPKRSSDGCGLYAAFGTAHGLWIGAAAGFATGVVWHGRSVVYRAEAGSAPVRVGVAPIVSRSAKGLALSLSF